MPTLVTGFLASAPGGWWYHLLGYSEWGRCKDESEVVCAGCRKTASFVVATSF